MARKLLAFLTNLRRHARGLPLGQRAMRKPRTHAGFRWVNEVPVLLLTTIVVPVVVEPF